MSLASPRQRDASPETGPALHSPSSRFVPASTAPAEPSSTAAAAGEETTPTKVMDRPTTLPPMRTSPERRPDDRLRLSTQQEDWPRIPLNGQFSHETLTGSHAYQLHMSYYDEGLSRNGSHHKRKRSDVSEEGRRRSPSGHASSRRYDAVPDPRPLEHRPYGGAASPRRDSYAPPPSAYTSLSAEGRPSTSSGTEGWYGSQAQGIQSAPAGHTAHSDAQLAEALQRENQQLDSNRGTSTGGSLDDDEMNGQLHRGSDYGTDHTPTTGGSVDHRRRKRIFSNRTKTGCMTCRRRKKKCDEQKPDCRSSLSLSFSLCLSFFFPPLGSRPRHNIGDVAVLLISRVHQVTIAFVAASSAKATARGSNGRSPRERKLRCLSKRKTASDVRVTILGLPSRPTCVITPSAGCWGGSGARRCIGLATNRRRLRLLKLLLRIQRVPIWTEGNTALLFRMIIIVLTDTRSNKVLRVLMNFMVIKVLLGLMATTVMSVVTVLQSVVLIRAFMALQSILLIRVFMALQKIVLIRVPMALRDNVSILFPMALRNGMAITVMAVMAVMATAGDRS